MSQKHRKAEECISIEVEAQSVVSYVDYFLHVPVFSALKIRNDGANIFSNLIVELKNENGLLIPFSKEVAELPFESTIEVEVGDVLSPLYFTELEEIKEEEISIIVKLDGDEVASTHVKVRALPFDYWVGTGGNNEFLASFVRPKLADCSRMRSEIVAQLKKWDISIEIGNGYDGLDKNAVRHIAAALYSCIRRYSFEREEIDISIPVLTGNGIHLLSEKKANTLIISLFFSACLENLGLYPIVILGEKNITCGVWLYENCFMDTVSDDMERLQKYLENGINNLSCFDVEDLFSDKNAAYSTSETHFMKKLSEGDFFDKCLDIHRCRIGKIYPLPLKARTHKGYEILSGDEMSPEALPQKIIERKNLKIVNKQSKDKQWERRLLDLSLKNTLLNFSPTKGALHIISIDADKTKSAIEEKNMLLTSTENVLERSKYFGLSKNLSSMKELIDIEEANGILRIGADEDILTETATRLLRKAKEADEESGAKILYLAFGFLKWVSREDKCDKYAPLILQPVSIKKAKGGKGYELSLADDDFSINSTLLEFLKQEFNIDIRGLDGAIQGLKISEILAMVRLEIVDMKDWEVFDDIYLSAFSFSRFEMWQDLRKNIGEFSKNELIASLLHNHSELKDSSDINLKEDDCPPIKTLTPLPADSSQWEAIALSQTGKTFVLYGPPGTGKSQTITNIIANALNDNRKVLFVAEKQAALSVVKKRLDAIGLGDFCLELHSGKTNKTDVLQKLNATLALAGTQEPVYLTEKSDNINYLKEQLAQNSSALHKKRRLGVSIYEALLICLRNKNAPDIMNIESSFYDSLTREKIEQYKVMMSNAASAAKECGGVYNSPFTNVNLTEYTRDKRDAVYCSSEVIIVEIKHLKNYIALFLELYRQKISTFTRKKLDSLKEVVDLLSGDVLQKYYKQKEEEFSAFFAANRRLDACFEFYDKNFKKMIDLSSKEVNLLGVWLEKNTQSYVEDKTINSIAKRLSKISAGEFKSDNMVKYLETVFDIYSAMDRIRENTDLSSKFTSFGRVDYDTGRSKFLNELYRLHELCESLFMDYNADSFNSMCIRAANGYTNPVLAGLKSSIDSFRAAEESFIEITNAERTKIPEEDIFEYYTTKAGALIDNIDMLANWCMYKSTTEKLDEAGLTFITDALENGRLTGENIINSFEKNIYRNFLQTNVPLDPVLSRFSAAIEDEQTDSLRLFIDDFAKLSAREIRSKLISAIPTASTEGSLSLELVNFARMSKSNLRGSSLRKFFAEIPELMKVIAPCMLMSPITVAQYLRAENGMFDLVIFDEASQMPTSEAIGSIARAKSAIIVGDPKQLPPTSFFNANYVDEENLENEDLESVLDDCLSLGIPERHLTWHYRSKHESLIAFSNIMYYGNKLCTFPSPDALASKVRFVRVQDGVYDRGFTKRNKGEGDALIAEVLRRLSDPILSRSSIGIVTFSSAQMDYVERKLTAAIAEKNLEAVAYDREEPLFVKNLENVQGDERDVILFSVCYGPDKTGRISLNFGPLNQSGGWRRLNVAVSRAREEMVIFSSMTGAMIDLSKTSSKGVAGLKAFLEFAEKGKANLAIPSNNLIAKKSDIGKYIAEELSSYGYDCRYDVGVSEFKIDVAVVDPKNKHKFILAIMCDGNEKFSIKDRNVLQIQTLKRNNWNVIRVYSINYYNNPKREIKRIKDMLDRLTGADKKSGSGLARAKKTYKPANIEQKFENGNYVVSGENDAEIMSRLKAIVTAEEPISYTFLLRRCLNSLGIIKYGVKIEGKMQELILACSFKYERFFGEAYYRKTDKNISFDKYRVELGDTLRKNESDFTPYEIIGLIRGALEDKVALYVEEIMVIVCNLMRLQKPSEKFSVFVNDCISLGEEKGIFVRSVSDRISLA